MALTNEIDGMRKNISTDDYKISFGELISMYKEGEVDIHPEFQRFFRWTISQKSLLIESILLGIPIPPIFISQKEDGVFDVVDGLQRLSTIFEFVGILEDEAKHLMHPLKLQGTKYLPSLEGKKWDDPYDEQNSFTNAERLFIKRSKISLSIVEKASDDIFKYELFQRLNTGGSDATAQEVRNCIMVMYNRNFYFWLRDLADYEPFRECIVLTDKAISEQYDMELVLRFLVFRKVSEAVLRTVKDIGSFMTDSMVEMAKNPDFNFAEAEMAFKTTFDVLYANTKSDSFRKYNPETNKFSGGFLVSPFETIAIGIGYNYKEILKIQNDIEGRVKSIWTNTIYNKNSGSGATATQRLPKIIPLGREIFKP